MNRYRIWTIILVVAMLAVGYFNWASETRESGFVSKFPFTLGLDLAGGTQLSYKADVSRVEAGEVESSMEALRDVIERRVNLFGVSEPVVQVEEAGTLAGRAENKLIVELPGVTDVQKAIELIGQTPILEFKTLKPGAEELLQSTTTEPNLNEVFEDTGLTGRFVERAQLQFDPTTNQPAVLLTFNGEGKDLFARITRENVGSIVAIFLDGAPISTPVVQDEITDGQAVISGNFTIEEARTLIRNLNYGALPVPIELVGTQTVGPSLGQEAVNAGLNAGLWGFVLVALFLVVWYRLPGVIATVALLMYVLISLAIFKLIPVTLTAAGIAGFILSVGMAVDANILIFERMKEELRKGKNLTDSMREGFHRAWLSIRDSNISSIITAIVLFWLGTSAVKGFALTLGVGVLVSMFTAITVSRTFLYAIAPKTEGKSTRFLFGSGIKN